MPADARFCSFCGLAQKDAWKMVAGSGVNICDHCIVLATEVVLEGAAKANDRVVLSLVSDAAARCGFCGKTQHQAPLMASAADARTCGECVALLAEVVEVITPERQRELDRKVGRRPPGPRRSFR